MPAHPLQFASRAAGACALALALLSPAQAAPVLGLSTQATATGVDLTVGVRDIADLYGYQFTLNFAPGLLSFGGGTEGSFLAGAGATLFDAGTFDGAAGSLSFVFGTLLGPGPGATGSGDLARFSFGGAQAGLAAFAFSDVLFLDSNGDAIPVAAGGPASEVPEPATLWLTGIGLFALLGRQALRTRAR